jgi:hypothetical protein
MPAELPVTVVADPHDTARCARAVAALACLPAGRAVCHPTPGERGLQSLAVDLLVALGKRFDALQVERAQRRSWPLVRIWLDAEPIRHLFVLRAHMLTGRQWQALINLGHPGDLNLWLIIHQPRLHADQERILDRTVHRHITLDAFLHRWNDPEGPSHPSAQTAPGTEFPAVPADDFPVFRATCRRRLDTASFALVDQVYCASMDQTSDWLTQQLGRTWFIRSTAELPIQSFLQHLVLVSTSPQETLVRLRGAQAALFMRGILLTVQPGPSGMARLADLHTRLDPTVIARLRGLCTPRSAAALTLALATELPPSALADLDVSDVADDGSAVRRAAAQLAVPTPAHPLIRAHLLERTAEHAEPPSPLFTSREGGRITGPTMHGLLQRLATRTAVAIPAPSRRPSYTAPWQDWMVRRGLAITDLGPPSPRR